MTQIQIYADPDMPGNNWKATLPDGSFVYFDSKEKAKKFVELYSSSLKSPKKRKGTSCSL